MERQTVASASIAVVMPTLDLELYEAQARAAVMEQRSGVGWAKLFCVQDSEPLQRYTKTVNRGLRLALDDEWSHEGAMLPWDYICLMNDDTEPVTRNWLAELVWCMEQNDEIGYVAPAQPCRTEGMMEAEGPTDEPELRYIFAVPFGCVLIRREVFQDVGLLDPTFVHYCSDTDHQYRARAFGWMSAWAPHIWVNREAHEPKLAQQWYVDRARFYERWPRG